MAMDTANDRFKQGFNNWFWGSVAVATLLHFAIFAFFPKMQAEDVSSDEAAMTNVELPPEIEIPPPPQAIARPATPVITDAQIDDDITIASTTFEDNPVENLSPPPSATAGASEDLSRAPTFTPMTVRPELRNSSAVQAALVRNYPPLLRDARVEGTVTVRFRVNEEGRQVFRCVKERPECVNGETLIPIGDDDTIIGEANPAFSLGLNSSARWGRIDASWLWRGEFGRDVFNNTALVYSTTSNVLSNRNFMRSALGNEDALDEPAKFSSRWIEDGSFLRLQNLTLGYTFDLPTSFGAGRQTRLYLSGDNLLLFTGYSGYDPEVFVARGLASRGIDYVTYPRARTFTLGARIQF